MSVLGSMSPSKLMEADQKASTTSSKVLPTLTNIKTDACCIAQPPIVGICAQPCSTDCCLAAGTQQRAHWAGQPTDT